MRNTPGFAEFYKGFKGDRKATVIAELFTIPNWHTANDDPNEHASQAAANNCASSTHEILNAARSYYEFLFEAKEALLKQPALDRLVQVLSSNTIPQHQRAMCEEPFTASEITKVIKGMQLNKACGPDQTPSEIFRFHAKAWAPVLAEAFNQLHAQGKLTDSMMEGELTLLYKKKDRRDIRNYRPHSPQH